MHYCRKLACSTVSLTGDRVIGDDSKQYRYYKNMYSTVQSFFYKIAIKYTFMVIQYSLFFSPARSSPRRIFVVSPPAIPLTCPPRTTEDLPRSCGGILGYLYKRMERQSYPPQTTADSLTWEFLTTGCKFLIIFIEYPSPRG